MLVCGLLLMTGDYRVVIKITNLETFLQTIDLGGRHYTIRLQKINQSIDVN